MSPETRPSLKPNFTPTLAAVERLLEKMEQRDVVVRKQYTIDRMSAAMLSLGSPQDTYINIHIAGTSGKGSTAHMMAAVLEASSTKRKKVSVGLYTSPALASPLERIQLNGKPITPAQFMRTLQRLWPTIELHGLTYFETFTAVAFAWFADLQVDYAVMETGLGGRLDATNVSPSHLALLTDIGLDHTKQLGNTRAKIAKEKQGIIKSNSLALTTSPYVKKAKSVQPDSATITRRSLTGTTFHYQGKTYTLGMLGDFQVRNATLVIAAAQALHISPAAIKRGLRHAQHPARFQVISSKPLIIVDGAHNPQKMSAFVKSLNVLIPKAVSRQTNAKRIGLIALKHDKDMTATLKPLIKNLDRVVISEFTGNSYPAAKLAKVVKSIHPKIKMTIQPNLKRAYTTWRKELSTDDLGVITGSLYMIGELAQKKLIQL